MSTQMTNPGNQIDLFPSSSPAPEAADRVMVVEDDPAILQALRIRLEYEGFKVCTASGGQAALATFKDFSPTIAVLDINMPGIDGIELAERIQDADSNCKLIFLTASRSPELKTRANQLNIHAYMEKPYGSRELVEQIQRCGSNAG